MCWLPSLPSSSFIALIVLIHLPELSRKFKRRSLPGRVAFHKRAKPSKHLTTFLSSHFITVIKNDGRGFPFHWDECSGYTWAGRAVSSVLAEGAFGSCPLNPVPTPLCCQAPWVSAAMEKGHFLYKPHLFHARHRQQPQKGHFLASRKPAWTINRVCLTCSAVFFQTCTHSSCGFF